MPKTVIVYKNIGETPLEALERFRRGQMEKVADMESKNKWQEVPMTYAGRLDPLAEGELLLLIGDECKNKEKYLGLDKEYEVEVVFGVSTDTYDALGLITGKNLEVGPQGVDLTKYIGKFTQAYPPYSSKTVNGKQLHELAKADELPEEMPTKEVEIYSIEDLGTRDISGREIVLRAIENIKKVKGDFRQKEIIAGWNHFQGEYSDVSFQALKIRVKCSGGVYMRSLAHRMGIDRGTGAFASSIERTRIVLST